MKKKNLIALKILGNRINYEEERFDPLNDERYRGGRSRRLIWEEILMIEQVSLFGQRDSGKRREDVKNIFQSHSILPERTFSTAERIISIV